MATYETKWEQSLREASRRAVKDVYYAPRDKSKNDNRAVETNPKKK